MQLRRLHESTFDDLPDKDRFGDYTDIGKIEEGDSVAVYGKAIYECMFSETDIRHVARGNYPAFFLDVLGDNMPGGHGGMNLDFVRVRKEGGRFFVTSPGHTHINILTDPFNISDSRWYFNSKGTRPIDMFEEEIHLELVTTVEAESENGPVLIII